MKWFVYKFLFTFVYLALLPSFLLRMKRRGGYKARMGDRFGRYPSDLTVPTQAIWIHAVSVGEVSVAGQLMRALREKDPLVRFVFSTTSSTGWKQAEKELGEGDVLIYNPLDFGGAVRRALDFVRPRAVVLTESEIWPTFIREVKKREIPLYLVNARVSDRSAPRYRALRWWFGEVLRAFTTIYAQSDVDAQRLIAAGASPQTVKVTGSFKFDVAHRDPAKEDELAEWIRAGEAGGAGALLPGFKMPAVDAESHGLPPILLGGSTWPGEDEVLLNVYRRLLRRDPTVRLVIVPRHFEKADAVEANILRAGFRSVRRSRAGQGPVGVGQPNVYLGDTTGEMMGFFGLATVAFVGKSLCAHGSQNMIEPCLCGVPTLVGPYTENFRPVMSDLLTGGAIAQVSNEEELSREIVRLFANVEDRQALGRRAQEAVRRRCGVVRRCADELLADWAAHAAHLPDHEAVSGPRRRGRGLKWSVAAVLLASYALSGWLFTPSIHRGWQRLQKNATRRYATFLGLSVASVVFPWCIEDLRTTYIRLATRDYGFAGGKPYKTEIVKGRTYAYYRDADYGGDVVTRDGWPIETGTKYKATRLLAELIPFAEGKSVAGSTNFASKAEASLPARRIDGRLLTMARLKGILAECREEFGDYKFWCLGRYDYLVTPARRTEAARVMALFDAVRTFEQFAEAGIYAPADLYACYVGSAADVEPALEKYDAHGPLWGMLTGTRLAFSPPPEGNLTPVRPSLLTPRVPPVVAGLEPGPIDDELFALLTNRIATAQRARRDVLMGLDAADRGVSSNALAHWSAAAKANPRDPLLKNLADTLDLEGRRRLRVGDVNGALHCYENRIVVMPHDVAAIHNFALCLKRAGHVEMAARVFLKAVSLDPKTDEHRLEFVSCAAASGHLDAACRQIEVLMVHRPDDPALKLRAARLFALEKNPLRNETRAISLAESAATMTKWRDRAIVQGLADVYISCGRTLMGMGLKKHMKEMTFDR